MRHLGSRHISDTNLGNGDLSVVERTNVCNVVGGREEGNARVNKCVVCR